MLDGVYRYERINMENLKFEEMNLSYDIVRAVKDMGFEEATPIQSQAISVIMEGKDIIGQSQTGTGKTAAFGLPCLEMLDPDNKGLQALILCPTRELAIQVSEEFRKFLKYKENIKVLPIYGGQPIDRQITALKIRSSGNNTNSRPCNGSYETPYYKNEFCQICSPRRS